MNTWIPNLEVKYAITKSANPLEHHMQEETNIFNPGVQRDFTDSLDNAVEKFIAACNRLDSGCVQLWEKGSVIGKLYI
jgi:hypothetical protein